MMKKLHRKTILHILELAGATVAAYLVLTLFGVDHHSAVAVLTIAFSGAAKYVRENEDIPVPDYVNK